MTRILTTSLLALSTSLAYVGVASANTALSTFEKGDPDVYRPVAVSQTVSWPQTSQRDSLDRFELGDPDASVISQNVGSAKQSSPSGLAMTSLAQFERGDPGVSPGV
jgi:hypothetical protein